MKKLVLSVAIVAAVALSACKKEAPAQTPEDPQIEVVVPEEAAPVDEATVPVDETAAPAEETAPVAE
jgi:hypothetical protein